MYDYKFFCFKGIPYVAYAAMDHFKNDSNQNNYPISFYDLDWNIMDVRYGSHDNNLIPKPTHLKEMIEICKILSKDDPFVRVDFFDLESKLYLAELTFYPGGDNTDYRPLSFDKYLGDLFDFNIDIDKVLKKIFYA